jgi:predicted YcjX-like family ATPase
MHSVKPIVQRGEPALDREQKMAALSYVNEAWAEARLDGIDNDCMAMTCLFAAFTELVSTYGEDAAAKYADSLSKRIRNGEFTVDIPRQ